MDELEKEWQILKKAQAIIALDHLKESARFALKLWQTQTHYQALRADWKQACEDNSKKWQQNLLPPWWDWEKQVQIYPPLFGDIEEVDQQLRNNFSHYDELKISDKVFLHQLYGYSQKFLEREILWDKLAYNNNQLSGLSEALGQAAKIVRLNQHECTVVDGAQIAIILNENKFYVPMLELSTSLLELEPNSTWASAVGAPIIWNQN